MIQLHAQKKGVRVSSRYGETERARDDVEGTAMARLLPVNNARAIRCAHLPARQRTGWQRTATYNSLSDMNAFVADFERSSEPADHRSSRTTSDRAFAPARASARGQEGARQPAHGVRGRAGAGAVRGSRHGARRADGDRVLGSPCGAATRG